MKAAIILGTGSAAMRLVDEVAKELGVAPVAETSIDDISATPDLTGPYGQAWKLDPSTWLGHRPNSGLTSWLVEAPYAHPIWHSYVVLLIALRPVEGLPPAHIRGPGATHEFIVAAIDPAKDRAPILTGKPPAILTPLNFGAQLVGMTDDGASLVVREIAQQIIDGTLNPDTDNRREWIARFGSDGIKS